MVQEQSDIRLELSNVCSRGPFGVCQEISMQSILKGILKTKWIQMLNSKPHFIQNLPSKNFERLCKN